MNNFNGWFNYTQANFILRIDYDVSNNPIYLGWAAPGSSESATVWRIARNTFTGSNMMARNFPSGSPAFGYSWTNRASYSYS